MYPLEVAPEGTGTTIWLFDQLVGIAVGPLTVTVLWPWVEPKFDPTIVMEVPTAACGGFTEDKNGLATTVRFAGTLATPLTLTLSENTPVVEAQFAGSIGPMLFALHVGW
jgi:hypothetical protein